MIIWIFRQEYVIDATCFWKIEELMRSFITQNLCVLVECAVAKKKKAGRPKVKDVVDTPEHPDHCLVICSKCFSRIGKGYRHDCTRRSKVANVESLE